MNIKNISCILFLVLSSCSQNKSSENGKMLVNKVTEEMESPLIIKDTSEFNDGQIIITDPSGTSSDYVSKNANKSVPKTDILTYPSYEQWLEIENRNNIGGGVYPDNDSIQDMYGGVDTKPNTESYNEIVENDYKNVRQQPLSTFSIDVDTASYSNMRRYLKGNQLPPKDSIRVEELVNYFSYDYPQPQDEPFSRVMEVAECPWNSHHWLVHIGIQGLKTHHDDLPPTNLVFLLDVSGSMDRANKLPLMKTAMGLLTEQLRPQDKVSIVVYAGAAGVVLPPTSGADKNAIMSSLSRLQAGGSTNGGQGIELAYLMAQQNFIPGAINRVILATDGDFNVGVAHHDGLMSMIEEKRKTGIFLTVLGLGMGNLKDSMMEQLADKGNGSYAYIDTLAEAKKVLIHELGSTLFTIAKDVKIQVEFNPRFVSSYRLVGYENRVMRAQDFNDDTKDAGEIGSGHTVTALYEVVPTNTAPTTTALNYTEKNAAQTNEILTLKIRYKEPDQDVSQLLTTVLTPPVHNISNTSINFRFSAAVAVFAMLLRDSQYKNNASMELVKSLAMSAQGNDHYGYRREFFELVDIAKTLLRMKY